MEQIIWVSKIFEIIFKILKLLFISNKTKNMKRMRSRRAGPKNKEGEAIKEVSMCRRGARCVKAHCEARDLFSIVFSPFRKNGSETSGTICGGMSTYFLYVMVFFLAVSVSSGMIFKTTQNVNQLWIPATED